MNRPRYYGWVIVAIFWVAYGVMMGFPIYVIPVVNAAMVEALKLDRQTLGTMMGALSISAGFFAPVAAFVVGRIGTRAALLSYCAVAAVAMSAMALGQSAPVLLVLTYAVLGAVTSGAAIICQSAIPRWFVLRRGRAMGIAMTGSAVVGSICAMVLPSLMASHGWRIAWWVGLALVSIAAIACLFARQSPAQVGQFPDGASQAPAATPEQRGTGVYRTEQIWRVGEAIRTPAIWLIVGLGIARVLALAMFFTHAVVHLRDMAFSASEAALVISSFAVATFCGKLLSGVCTDYVEPRLLIALSYALLAVGLGLLIAPGAVGTIVVIGVLIGLATGTLAVCDPLIVSNYYGPQIFSSMLGFTAFLTAPLSAGASVAAGWWFDHTQSYFYALSGTAALCVGAGIGFLVLVRPCEKPPSSAGA